jgi:hypothetical protein
MSKEAMQLALDMLNEIADDVYCDQKLEGVIAVLRQALVDADDTSQKRVDEKAKREHEWVGLTDDERREIFDSCETNDRGYVLAMVEAKLKEKNHG